MIDMIALRSVTAGSPWAFTVWEPRFPMVVVGRFAETDKEVFIGNCENDGVPVYRRRSGGGTVVLSPGILVFSLAKRVETQISPKEYASQTNRLVIRFLENLGVKNLSEKGLSDICIGDRKILGSGIYRSKKVLFFQGSLLVNPDFSLFEKYLPHPPREPDYRMGRDHRSFVTSLYESGCLLSAGNLIKPFHDFLASKIKRVFKD